MTVKNKTNKNYKRSQKGRSMVEMLGVLAIVGVLSVGGVYGYGVAMKKHKANELLHQASMLAATVSAQIESLGGDLPETITDFGSTNYGKFSTSVTQTEDKKKFVLTIENVDSAVCDQLKKGGMVQGVDCKAGSSEGKKNAEITYYKNLATTEAEGEKSPTGAELENPKPEVVMDGMDPSSCTCPTGYFCYLDYWQYAGNDPNDLVCEKEVDMNAIKAVCEDYTTGLDTDHPGKGGWQPPAYGLNFYSCVFQDI